MARIAAAVLLILLGLARGIGGIVLAMGKPQPLESALVGPSVARVLGMGLLVVALLAFVAAIGLFARRVWAPTVALVAPTLFVLDGALNGYLLFGKPGAGGTLGNVFVAVAIIGFVLLARRRGELSRPCLTSACT